MILANIIFPFDGLNASIPSGWTRETTLDSKYLKAWGAVAPNNTGGANTHTHTGSHTHTMNAHTHTYATDYADDTQDQQSTDAEAGGQSRHRHGASDTTSTTTGGGLLSTTVTWSSVNHEPPYYAVIFIKPSGSMAHLSNGILAYFNKTINPSNWNLCDGSDDTSDIRGKYLKGATTGANAGGTGGATSHVHTVSHTHTVTAHSHTGNTVGETDNSGQRGYSVNATGSFTRNTHTHTTTFANTTVAINSYTNASAGGNTIDLAYKKMAIFENAGGGMIKGMVAMWLGATGSIPLGWKVCDGSNGTIDLRDKFIKTGQDLTQNGDTGGSNTHTHSAISHTHTATGSHTHVGSTNNAADFRCNPGGGGSNITYYAHTHDILSESSTTPTFASANISATTPDHQPVYRTVAYIEYKYSAQGGAMFFSTII